MTTNQVSYLLASDAARVHVGSVYSSNEPSLTQCLIDLRLTNPTDDKARIERQKGGLLENACSWILSHTDFVKWRNNETSQLLWIKGDPGKGKTMLLCGIINELKRSPTDGCILSFFFCQSTEQSLNNATAVLRGLIYMLADQDRSLLECVHEEYKKAGRKLFSDNNAWDALSRIFSMMVRNLDPSKSLVLVVDALDECEEDTLRLARLIIRNSTADRVKWIVSSRNQPFIEELFKSENQLRLCLELNKELISAAVDIYIQNKVGKLTEAKGYDPSIREYVESYLSLYANDTFLWVALICQRLEDPRLQIWRTKEELRRFPSGLDSLYERMARYIDESADATMCNSVIGVVTVTRRPITLRELEFLINWPKGFRSDLKSMRTLIKLCGSFLTLQDGVVRFIHQSAIDFLLKSDKIFPLGIEHVHYTVFSMSIKTMTALLWRDIYNLRRPDYELSRKVDITPPDPDPLAIIRYSCIHWVDHLDMSCSTSQPHREEFQDGGIAHTFLKKHFLHWLEALSLLRSMHRGIPIVSKLLQLVLKKGERSELSLLVEDAVRFLEFHQATIERNPLQVYISALIFSPDQSIIKRLFQGNEQRWLVTNWIKDHWGPSLKTLTIDNYVGVIQSIAFSQDSKLMAVALIEKVQIRLVSTGELQRELGGNLRGITSLTFSHDSKLLVVVSKDPAIQVWSVDTGNLKQILEGHSDGIDSVVFSPDSEFIVSGSRDKTVRMWSVKDGTHRVVKNHLSPILAVAFSPNGKKVASGSSDGEVRVWSPSEASSSTRILEGRGSPVLSLAFSPNSRFMAAGCRSGAIQIWCGAGVLRREILSSEEVLSLAFSPESEFIAVASRSGIIRIYSVAMGALKQILRASYGPVSAVAFSHNLELTAVGTYTSTIQICVTGNNTMDLPQEGAGSITGFIQSIVFSPTLKHFASASSCHLVQIWEADTGDCLQSIDVNIWGLELRFSKDGQFLYLHYCRYPGASLFGCNGRCLEVDLDLGWTMTKAINDFATRSITMVPSRGTSIVYRSRWVWVNGKKLLRLPSHCVGEISGSTLVLELHTGKVVTLWLSAEDILHHRLLPASE